MFDLILAMRPLIAIGVSMAAALLILLLGDRVQPNLREGMTFGAAIIKAACVFSMVPAVLAGETFDLTVLEIVEGIDLALKADSLGISVSARVTAKRNERGIPVPQSAELAGGYSAELAAWLERELDIPAERQVWNEVEN